MNGYTMIDLDRYDHTYARIIRNGDESNVKGPRIYPNTVTLEIKSGQADTITVNTHDSTTLEPVIIVKNKKQRRRQLLNMSKKDSQNGQKSLVKPTVTPQIDRPAPRRVSMNKSVSTASDNQSIDQAAHGTPAAENGITVLYPPSHSEPSAGDSSSVKGKKRKSPVKQTEPPQKASKKATEDEVPAENESSQETNTKVDITKNDTLNNPVEGTEDLNAKTAQEIKDVGKKCEPKAKIPTNKPSSRPSRGKSKTAVRLISTTNRGKNTTKKQQDKPSKVKKVSEVQPKKAVSTHKPSGSKPLQKPASKLSKSKGKSTKSKSGKLRVVLPRSSRASPKTEKITAKSASRSKRSRSIPASKIDMENIVAGSRRRRRR